MAGQLFVISGPSGVGKSTIIKGVRGRVTDLGYCISHTSRRPRKGEAEGRAYYFVKKEIFKKMIEEGAFVEWAEVYGDLYGTSFSSLNSQVDKGLDVVMDLDTQGAQNVKNHFKDSILVYILPPTFEALEERLRKRATDDEKIIERRVEKASRELKSCVDYDYLVFNDDKENAVAELSSIIMSERCRNSRRFPEAKKAFPRFL